MYAAHVSLAVGRPWSCMPKWQYGDIVDLIVFRVLNFVVNYNDYLLLNLRSPRDYVVVPSVVRSRLWYVLDRLRACGMC